MPNTDLSDTDQIVPKKKRKAFRIAGGILLLLIAAAILLSRSAWLRNTIALAALSPSSYYKMTEAAGLASDTGALADTAKKIADYINPGEGKGNASRLTAQIRFADGLLPFSLSLPDITADMTFSFAGGIGKTQADAKAGLIKIKALGFVNPADGLAYLGFPDLTASFLKYTSSPKTLSLPGGASITLDLRAATAGEWKSLFQKLAKILSDSADSVVLLKNQTAECSGLSDTYTKIQVLFEPETQCDILETLCTEPALNHGPDSSERFNRTDFLAQAEPLTMTVWVDSRGKVTGREFQSASKPSASLSWMLINDGSRYGFAFHSSDGSAAGGPDAVTVTGTAQKLENRLSGTIETSDKTSVSFTDLEWIDQKTGQFCGTFEIHSKQGTQTVVACSAQDGTQTASVTLYKNGSERVTANLTLSAAPFEAFALPDESAVKIYDFSDGISGFLKETGLFDLFDGLFFR